MPLVCNSLYVLILMRCFVRIVSERFVPFFVQELKTSLNLVNRTRSNYTETTDGYARHGRHGSYMKQGKYSGFGEGGGGLVKVGCLSPYL